MKSKGFTPIVVLLTISVVAVLFYFVNTTYFKKSSNPKPWQPITTSVPPSVSDWKTFKHTNPGYEIQYPHDWQIDTIYADSNNMKKIELSMNNSDYAISITWPQTIEPAFCIFSDNAQFGKGLKINHDCPGEFVEFKSDTSVFRRSLKPFIIDDILINNWSIYMKNSSGEFVSLPQITYKFPKNYDTNLIVEMDHILTTLKFTN